MHMRNAEPFDAQNLFIANKIMRQANRIQPARNRKQQAFETIMANIFSNGTFQKKSGTLYCVNLIICIIPSPKRGISL